MIGEKWLDGPNRICEIVKEIQTGKSVKMAVLEVRDEFTKELLFYQTTKRHVVFRERGLADLEMNDPYLARPVFTEKNEAIKHCKNLTKKEDDQIKEAERKD